MERAGETTASDGGRRTAYRHSLSVRVTHWLNVLFLTIMLGSGLQIFNAHPSLYWGSRSDPGSAWLTMEAVRSAEGELRGRTRIFGLTLDTTGVLGLSESLYGGPEARGFPTWATIPSHRWLAMGRRWHFFFAWLFVVNGVAYLGLSVANRHFSRDLLPTVGELRGIGKSLRHHLSLRNIREESGRGYNVIQKLTYLAVVFALGPLVLLTGLTMSPWMDTVAPQLLTVFDGRQSARTIHFLVALAFVLFVLVHVTMVLLVGPVNHIRAMITGRLKVKDDE